MNRVPMRIMWGKSPPLAARSRHVEDRVHYLPFGPVRGSSHPTAAGVGRNQIRDQLVESILVVYGG